MEVRYPPPQKGYLSDTRAIPYENKANGLCDTISKGYCAIWGGISHSAAKGPTVKIARKAGATFATQRSWERAENRKIPKVARKGCQRSFGPKAPKASFLHWCKRELHQCKTGFRRCKGLLGDLCNCAPKVQKHLLHPLLTTLGTFEVSGLCLGKKKSMAMAMFKRKFARTIPDNLRAPHIKMWGFEAKRARKFTRTSPRTLPFFFITMLFSSLICSRHLGL